MRIGDDVDLAARILRDGGVVAIPTETVYGLAADATQPDAIARIFELKGRPRSHPLIVHLAGVEQLDGWAGELSRAALTLTQTCWPGPLTVVVPRGARVIDAVTGGRPSVGLRVPAHPLTLELLQRLDTGLAAPSANRFGHVSPTTAQHVANDLGAGVGYILDGGACPVGVESTIVDCTTEPPQLLRPGAITWEELATLLGTPPAAATGPARASGMLASHYAPRARVVLVNSPAEAEALHTPNSRIIGDVDDLATYAATLYAQLRAADDAGVDTIIAVLPPAAGLGHAIRDRLGKAAAPRP